MGTLLDQPERQFYSTMRLIQAWGRDLDFPELMEPADWHALCDLVRTAIAVQNADIQDEQLAGFGEILQNLVEAIREMTPAHGFRNVEDN
jgi:hypothetical protein